MGWYDSYVGWRDMLYPSAPNQCQFIAEISNRGSVGAWKSVSFPLDILTRAVLCMLCNAQVERFRLMYTFL